MEAYSSSPSHRYRYEGEGGTDNGKALNAAFNLIGDETAIGYAAGVGLSKKRRVGKGPAPTFTQGFGVNVAFVRIPGQVSELTASLAFSF